MFTCKTMEAYDVKINCLFRRSFRVRGEWWGVFRGKASIKLSLSGASVGLVIISRGSVVFSVGLVVMSGSLVVFSGKPFCFKRLPWLYT